MRTYPEAQKKAQDEIDAVIGTHRLPTWEDRPSLPYVEALYREVMRFVFSPLLCHARSDLVTCRWHPVTPIGVPHATLEDDIYNGNFIPKGTAVVANIWFVQLQTCIVISSHVYMRTYRAMTHNENAYPDPYSFKPERFFTSDGTLNDDDTILAFGFGRR